MKLIILFLLFGLTSSMSFFDLPKSQIHSIMTYLKKHGQTVLQEMNTKNEEILKTTNPDKTFTPIKQYMVAAVVSWDELNIDLYDQLMNDLLVKERLKVYLNERDREHGRRKFHGEMIFLHKGGLDEMVEKLKEEKGHITQPIVLLYSFYIPCAHVHNLGYSCSEEIGHAAKIHKYPMYVYFSNIFSGTDKAQAIQYLAKGEFVKLFSEELSDYVTLAFTPPPDVERKTFQMLFSECLFRLGIGSCNDDGNNRLYITRFVNLVVYECTHGRSDIGVLTEYTRNYLLNCISKYLHSNSTPCGKCKRKPSAPKADVVIFIFRFCSESVMDTDLYLGKVQHLDDSSWERFEGRWQDLTSPLNPNGYPPLPCRAIGNPMDTCIENLKEIIRLSTDWRKIPRLLGLLSKGEAINGARTRTLSR